ncbi:MAG: hypothetical protein AB1894_29585 [Chloroflexota bacterium]
MLATLRMMKRMRERKRQLEQAAGLVKPPVPAAGAAAQEPVAAPAAEPEWRGRLLGGGVAVVRVVWSLTLDAVWLVAILVVVVVAAGAAGWEHPALTAGEQLINKILEGAMPGESNR